MFNFISNIIVLFFELMKKNTMDIIYKLNGFFYFIYNVILHAFLFILYLYILFQFVFGLLISF